MNDCGDIEKFVPTVQGSKLLDRVTAGPLAAPVWKMLRSNLSFKSLVMLLDKALNFNLSNIDVHKNSNGKEADRVQSVADKKIVFNAIIQDQVEVASIMSRVSSRTLQAKATKMSDQPKLGTSIVSENALVEKFLKRYQE